MVPTLLPYEGYTCGERCRPAGPQLLATGRKFILIQGLAKSGTSALAYKIANSLPPEDTEVLFEPSRYAGSPARNVVAKILIDGYLWSLDARHDHIVPPAVVDLESFACFDKNLLIVRDPRDRLISLLLYMLFHEPYCRDAPFAESVIRILRQKEADPDSIRFMDFMMFIKEYPRFAEQRTTSLPRLDPQTVGPADIIDNRLLRYIQKHPELFLVYYEDMVDEDLGPLEEYLGITLCGTAEVAPAVKRVERTKTYGNYQNWFTAGDVPYFERLFAEYNNYFPRYKATTLNQTKVLRPEHGSDYVLRLVNEARGSLNLTPIQV